MTFISNSEQKRPSFVAAFDTEHDSRCDSVQDSSLKVKWRFRWEGKQFLLAESR
jgi:hypothetical protein